MMISYVSSWNKQSWIFLLKRYLRTLWQFLFTWKKTFVRYVLINSILSEFFFQESFYWRLLFIPVLCKLFHVWNLKVMSRHSGNPSENFVFGKISSMNLEFLWMHEKSRDTHFDQHWFTKQNLTFQLFCLMSNCGIFSRHLKAPLIKSR